MVHLAIHGQEAVKMFKDLGMEPGTKNIQVNKLMCAAVYQEMHAFL